MPRALLFPLTMMLLIATGITMLASAMLLPRSDALEVPVASGTAVVEQFYAAVNETIATGNLAALRQVVPATFADENPLPGVNPGRGGLEAYLLTLHDADPGLRLTADVISASANLVVTRVQNQRDATTRHSATVGDAQAVWSPIEVFRVADGRIVRRWGQTDGLSLAQPLAEQQFKLPVPTPRVVSLTRVTQVPGTRWDAPRVDGPRLLVLESGVLDVQVVPGSADVAAQAVSPSTTERDGDPADALHHVMLTAGKTWLAPAGAMTSMTSAGSTAAQLLVVTFSEPRLPNGITAAREDLPAGVTVQVLAGDLATTLGTGSVTVCLEQLTLAPEARLNLWSTQGPILVAVDSGQLRAMALGTAWMRRHRDGMSVAFQEDVLTRENGLLVQPDGMVVLDNTELQPAHALVVTIHRVEDDRGSEGPVTSSAVKTSPTA